MARYLLHARRFEGSLAAPRRNDTEQRETDDHTEAEALGTELAQRGFRVWLYRHDQPDTPPGFTPAPQSGYRLIREW